MALHGAVPFKDRVWNPGVKISGMNSPAEEWMVDPNLPPLGTDPRYPTTDQIVIPRGRLLAVRQDTTTYTGRAVLTIADGTTSTRPQGYTETNIFREWQEKIQWMPSMSRQEFIEVPYVAAINAAYGALYGGYKIAAFDGWSVANGAAAPNDVGKIVKWTPNTTYSVTIAASTMVALPQAVYHGITPVIILAWDGASVSATGSSATLTWNNTYQQWIATFKQTVTTVLYSFGHTAAQIAGEVIRIEPVTTAHHLSGWLEWVTDNFLAWEYPPQLMRVPVTAVTTETPSTVTAGSVYCLANKPVAPWVNIDVIVTGSLIAPDGTSTTLTSTTMSKADLPFVDYTMGTYYNINPITGYLYFSSNVTVSSVTVSYSYETSYRDGRLFNQGIVGLTDGKYSGVPGTPANLEVAGVVGSLRCLIY